MNRTRLAEAVGLWIAEGDRATDGEITFTNASRCLVRQFFEVLCCVFPDYVDRIRLYVYSDTGEGQPFDIPVRTVRRYQDERANRPYAILRLASVDCLREWRRLYDELLADKTAHPDLLRGIFAGEGTVHISSRNSRTLRIAQLKSSLLERLLKSCGFSYSYYPPSRTYEVSKRHQWDLAAEMDLCGLHPAKAADFKQAYAEFIEYHYPKGFLERAVLKDLHKPYTAQQLADKYDRSRARLSEVLGVLRKKGFVKKFGVLQTTYWLNSRVDKIVISSRKDAYLQAVASSGCRSTADVASYLNTDHSNASRRLRELQCLGLLDYEDGCWKPCKKKKDVHVI